MDRDKILLYRQCVSRSYDDFCRIILKETMPPHSSKWVEFAEDNPLCCVLGPREHVKTATFERYILWKILKNRDLRIILISDTQSLSTTILRYPKSQIEGNPVIKQLYGNLIDDRRWRDDEIIVKRPNKSDRNATLYAIGMFGAIVGRRADLIILDDPIDMRKAATTTMKQKCVDWIFKEVWGTLAPDGKVIFIGSRKGPNDLYHYIKTDKKTIPILEDRAVIDYTTKEVLWPDHWPFEALMKRKEELGAISFELNFQNNILSHEHTVIGDPSLVDNCVEECPPEYQHDGTSIYAMGVDFSVEDNPVVAAEKDSDYMAITIMKRIGDDKTSCKHKIVYSKRWRGKNPDEQEEKVIELSKRFKPVLIYCEANGFQRMYSYRLRRRTDYPIQPFTTTKLKWSPVTGLPSLRQRFDTKKYVIPCEYDYELEKEDGLERLKTELKLLAPEGREHDDMAMSFWFCDRALINAPDFYQKVRVSII